MLAIDAQWLPADWPLLCGVAATFLVAGLVKGVVGLGLPTVAMGVLGTFMLPAQAATLLIVPSLVTNLWQTLRGSALLGLIRRLWGMQAGVLVGTLAAPVSLVTLDARLASAGLGAALIAYAGLGLGSVRLTVPRGRQRWASVAVGLATGFVTALTGVFVFPAVPYLQGLSLSKDELVQALGLSFTISTIALWWRLASDGASASGAAAFGWDSIVALLVALLGMAIGKRLRGRLSDARFRKVFFVGLLLIGLHLLLKAVLR